MALLTECKTVTFSFKVPLIYAAPYFSPSFTARTAFCFPLVFAFLILFRSQPHAPVANPFPIVHYKTPLHFSPPSSTSFSQPHPLTISHYHSRSLCLFIYPPVPPTPLLTSHPPSKPHNSAERHHERATTDRVRLSGVTVRPGRLQVAVPRRPRAQRRHLHPLSDGHVPRTGRA